jgi:hypothetical protein
VKLKWLQNPKQINGDNLKNLRYGTRNIFRKRKREYLKGRFNKLETNNNNNNNNNKNIRDLYRDRNEFK